ncbi:MAG: hypothetical protein HC788_03860 [Sphingopyxis sp.]|nr:hypothetical protein [Sphingopyxis sp.]
MNIAYAIYAFLAVLIVLGFARQNQKNFGSALANATGWVLLVGILIFGFFAVSALAYFFVILSCDP